MSPSVDDPLVQVHQLIADARHEFAQDVDLMLEAFAIATGVGVDMPLRIRLRMIEEVRRSVLEKFDQRLALRPAADPVLLQLVREAYDLLNNPETVVDLRDWTRTADPFVRR